MRLTAYTDYSLRVLIYLASKEDHSLSNIKEISIAYGISKNHLMKVTYELGKMGVIETIRGRNGGIRLAHAPSEINIGKIVRQTEEDFFLVDCFNPDSPRPCVISPVCGLTHALNKALLAYLKVLDGYTLADLVQNPAAYREFFKKKLESE
ncbi:Rrf2 family nitric oxide-sensitive transcriptional repressor [Oikeobacillus pervagus]|uniref:HTH-type transcriptional regulator NsrR n=1 Tax=Oikeobacillus pervagus TaxID=1325931 RepID=A0AAJ1T0P9_9BACI|nr:Rrf2 family transcriptional regulator [Oikeobacillus pervagus]MDQ0216505.1 Rrf2 family nitric oxide-sensitive transcriptional repressor [Oikeobacillus pervagus]